MTKVTIDTKIAAPADEVWRLVGGWNAPRMAPRGRRRAPSRMADTNDA